MVRWLKSKFKNDVSEQVKASTAYTICSILQKCLSLITLPVFARLLTTEEYGLSTVYGSVMSILICFTTLYLPYGSFATAMIKFEDDRDGYIASVNGICTVLTLLFLIIYIPFQKGFNLLFDLPTFFVVLMAFEMLASNALNLWMGKARFEYKYKAVVLFTLSTSIVGTLLSLIVVLLSSDKGVARQLCSCIFNILVGMIIYMLCINKSHKFYNKTYWKYALSFNIPLIPYYLSQVIFNQSDRLMINAMCGRGDAAMYGVAYNLALIMTFVLNAINNSFTPWLYGNIKNKDFRNTKQVSVGIALLMSVLLLGIIALAPEIILIMAGNKYSPAIDVVPPVAMSLLFLFLTQLFINIEFYFEEKYYIVGSSILSAVVNVVLNYFCIKKWGFVATAYTTLLSYILFAISNYFYVIKTCRKHDISTEIYDYKKLVCLSIGVMILGFLLKALYNYRYIRFGLIGMILIVVFVNRKRAIAVMKNYMGVLK